MCIDDECGAPEFFAGGAKLVGIPGLDGKITPAALAETLARYPRGLAKTSQPGALSLQPGDGGGDGLPARRDRRTWRRSRTKRGWACIWTARASPMRWPRPARRRRR